jgi:dolichol kinase
VEPESAERILAGVAIVATAYGALFGGVELLRRVGIAGETTRTIAHVCASLLALGVPLLFHSAWPVVLLAIAFAFLMVASMRTGLLGSIHDVSRRTAGAPMYPIGIAAAFVLTGGEAPGYAVAVLALGLGDPAASLAGRRYARRYATVWGVPRSLAGSTAACLVSAAVTAIVLLATGDPQAPPIVATSLAVGLAVALAEAASPSGLDNVAIPCIAATALDAAGTPWRIAVVLVALATLALTGAAWSRSIAEAPVRGHGRSR